MIVGTEIREIYIGLVLKLRTKVQCREAIWIVITQWLSPNKVMELKTFPRIVLIKVWNFILLVAGGNFLPYQEQQ